MAALIEMRLQQAQTERLAPLDFLSVLVTDELTRRADRLLERRRKQARFRDAGKTLDTFDFEFNRKMDRALIYQLATARFMPSTPTSCFSAHPARGKVISPRRSAMPRSSKATRSATARRSCSSKSWPTPPSTEHARSTSPNMVGNMFEWVADWVPRSTGCVSWGALSDDFMCLSRASTTATGPGALMRGGAAGAGGLVFGGGVVAMAGGVLGPDPPQYPPKSAST
jgi:hypothetical protein